MIVDVGFIRPLSISSLSSSSVRPASTANAVVSGFDHRFNGGQAGHRHIEQQVRAAAGGLYEAKRLAVR